jgi:hypothetical protein
MGHNLLLTIGALLLLGTLIVSTKNLISYNEVDSRDNEYVLAAYGAAQSIIDEAKTRAFDENTVAAALIDTAGLTLQASFGREGAGETVPAVDTMVTSAPFSATYPGYPSSVRFDDLDDYHGYTRMLKAARAYEGDTVRVAVAYVSLADPGGAGTGFRTLSKRMTVTVTGKYLSRPVTLSYGFTY